MFGTAIGWVNGLSIGSKVALGAATVVTGSAIATSPPPPTADVQEASVVQSVEPVTEIKTETDKQKIAFSKETIDSDSYDQGTVQVTRVGADGEKTLTYEATYVDGVLKDKKLVKQEVTKQPINEITTIGTRVVYVAPEPEPTPVSAPSNCDSNYSGACVPIASDVDCGSGSGNGPAYLYGTATVVGSDIYGLDRDGDGIACE